MNYFLLFIKNMNYTNDEIKIALADVLTLFKDNLQLFKD